MAVRHERQRESTPRASLFLMDDAAARRQKRSAMWTGEVYRGPAVHERLEDGARREWAEMAPLDRLALVWQLSLEQFGGGASDEVLARLPRSAYRLERR